MQPIQAPIQHRDKPFARLGRSVCAGLLALVVTMAAGISAAGQITPLPQPMDPDNPPANRLPGIKLDDARGRQLDLNLTFRNEKGQDVRLGDYFDGEKPVVLMLGYYSCPDLCGLVMNGMLKSFKGMEPNGSFGSGVAGFTLGQDYRAVTVSIDPRETADLAAGKQQRYAEQVIDAKALNDGWAMLVADDPESKNADRLARSLGFGYRYVKQSDRYGHAAAIYILSPDGLVTRMMYGMDYKPSDLKLSLIEASDGQVGSPLDQLILTCFRWDQSAGQYTPFAMGLLKIVAGVFLVMVMGLLTLAFLTEKQRKKRLNAPKTTTSTQTPAGHPA